MFRPVLDERLAEEGHVAVGEQDGGEHVVFTVIVDQNQRARGGVVGQVAGQGHVGQAQLDASGDGSEGV
ncbi:hypothetical protein U6M36_12275, partial [Cutibacterium acnes]